MDKDKLKLIERKIKWCDVQIVHATRVENWQEVERVKTEKDQLIKQREEVENGKKKTSF